MGLYLGVFDDDDELDGVEVGSYAYYNSFRDYVTVNLEGGRAGSLYPVLILSSDSDGQWDVSQCKRLRAEVSKIAADLKTLPPADLRFPEQRQIAKSIGLVPRNAFESFFDVDGEFLLDRLMGLIDLAIERELPILFQ